MSVVVVMLKGLNLWELLYKWSVSYGELKQFSKKTIENNSKFADLYFKFLNGREHSPDNANQFLVDGRNGLITGHKWKQNTENTRATKLRTFTRWCYSKQRVLAEDWSSQIEKIGEAEIEYNPISTKRCKEVILDMTKLLPRHNKKEIYTRTERRFYLLTLLLMSLRGGEPFSIRGEDLNLDAEDPYTWVKRKGGKRQKVLIHRDLVEEFRKRRDWSKIFTASQEVLQDDFRRLRKHYGLPKNFTMHKMRHELGTEMINNGASLMQAAKALGHSNTRTIEKYYYKSSLTAQTTALKTYAPTWTSSNNIEDATKNFVNLVKRSGYLDNPNISFEMTNDKESGEMILKLKPR